MINDRKYIGKHLLAGITYLDDKGEIVEEVQRHGTNTHIDESGIFFEQADGEVMSLPPDTDSLRAANPGVYRLRSTGEEVENPDFVTSWTVKAPSPQT